jgi:hypothetical protein
MYIYNICIYVYMYIYIYRRIYVCTNFMYVCTHTYIKPHGLQILVDKNAGVSKNEARRMHISIFAHIQTCKIRIRIRFMNRKVGVGESRMANLYASIYVFYTHTHTHTDTQAHRHINHMACRYSDKNAGVKAS